MPIPHNPQRGEFVVNLGGKERVGKLEMEQICQVEVALNGASVVNLMATQRFGFEALCQMLAVSLAATNPKITVMHVRRWVQNAIYEKTANVADLTALVQAAMMRALGFTKESKDTDLARKKMAEADDPDAEDGAAPAIEATLSSVDDTEGLPRPLARTAGRSSRSA